MSRDLTQGSINKGIVLYALPLLGAYILQVMYSAADALFAGNFLGHQGIAAIGSISLVAICLVTAFGGLSLGANVLAAHSFGAKNQKEIAVISSTAIRASLIGGVVICVVGIALSPAAAAAMQVPLGIRDDAIIYLAIYFLSLPAMVVYNMASGVLRGIGDSTTPLKAQIIGGLGNIALDALALVVLHLGVAGIALATVGCQILACIYTVYKLVSWQNQNDVRSDVKLSLPILKEMLRIGVPSAIQSFAITLSNLFIQFVINGLGEESIAAFVIYFQVEILVYEPLCALGQASTVFMAQNLGANQPKRARKGVRSCLIIGLACALATTASLMALADFAFGLFTTETTVIQLGTSLLFTTYPFYWLYAISEVCAGACKGMKHVKGPMITALVCYAGMRLALLAFSPLPTLGAVGVAWVFPITWFMASTCLAAYYLILVRKA